MGRKKLAAMREIATEREWLSPGSALPDDAQLATAFSHKEFLPASCIWSADPWRDQIAQWLDAGVPGTTIHSALVCIHGYEGSYSSVYRLLQQLKADVTPDVPITASFRLGEAAQVDFGAGPTITDAHTGEIHKAWFFVMTRCWSRHQYVEFVRDQSVDTWLLCHRHAFEWFNGVVGRVIIDNPKYDREPWGPSRQSGRPPSMPRAPANSHCAPPRAAVKRLDVFEPLQQCRQLCFDRLLDHLPGSVTDQFVQAQTGFR
jgi:hypothetical protein